MENFTRITGYLRNKYDYDIPINMYYWEGELTIYSWDEYHFKHYERFKQYPFLKYTYNNEYQQSYKPVDIPKDLEDVFTKINEPHNCFPPQVIYDFNLNEDEYKLSNIVKKHCKWHVYSGGGGDGGCIIFERLIIRDPFRASHNYIDSLGVKSLNSILGDSL